MGSEYVKSTRENGHKLTDDGQTTKAQTRVADPV